VKKQYYVYILRNVSGTIYIGITSNLIKRVWEHKNNFVEGFTKKYNVHLLIYYEMYNDPINAIVREKQIKKWSRIKKLTLIRRTNPTLSEIKTH